jgi:hypothetical protein
LPAPKEIARLGRAASSSGLPSEIQNISGLPQGPQDAPSVD